MKRRDRLKVGGGLFIIGVIVFFVNPIVAMFVSGTGVGIIATEELLRD